MYRPHMPAAAIVATLLATWLLCGPQSGARAEFTLTLSGPASATVGSTETLTGTLFSDQQGGLDLSNSTVSLTVLSAPPSFVDPTNFNINYPYDYPTSIAPTYTGNLFDLAIDPSTPTGIYDLEFTVDAAGNGQTLAVGDVSQTISDSVTGPSAVPEPSPLFSLALMSFLCAMCIMARCKTVKITTFSPRPAKATYRKCNAYRACDKRASF
jgi:hypothetical protein